MTSLLPFKTNTVFLIIIIIIVVNVLLQVVVVTGQTGHNFHYMDSNQPTGAGKQQQEGGGGEQQKPQSHVPHHHSLTIVLKNGDAERCFYVQSRVLEDRMFFEYRVRQGRPYFDVHVRSPDGQTIFQSLTGEYEETEGNKIFFISKTVGEYSLCLSGATQETAVTVNAAVASKKRATQKRDPVLRQVSMLKASLEGLLEDQDYLRSRERAHRDTLEGHNTQVLIRFFLEVIVLLGLSVGQVVFLRRLFDRKNTRPAA
jgi:p24 family protein beta-1